MTWIDGYSLADFVNENSARFTARTIDCESGCWVLIRDTQTLHADGHPLVFEPVADFGRYMTYVRRHAKLFPRDYIRLLENWQVAHYNT